MNFTARVCQCNPIIGSSGYGATRPDLIQTLKALEAEPAFSFEDSTRIKRAIDAFESGKADFADYLIIEISRVSGRQLLTFDRTLKKEIG